MMEQDGVINSLTNSQSRERKRKTMADSSSDNAEIRNEVMMKAREINFKLQRTNRNPTVTKLIMPSNLSPRTSKLCLPKQFCVRHMPLVDKQVTLKGENGKPFMVKFNWRDCCIVGGWRAFAIYHELEVGDALVFQLVSPLNFKVFVVKANASKEAGVDQGLLKSAAVKHEAESLGVEVGENNDSNSFMDDDVGSEPDKGFESRSDSKSKLPESVAVDFERVKRFEDFNIVANGSVINHELPELLRFKYYQLCRSQSSFLHQGLHEGLNDKIIAGMIDDVTSIAYAITAMSDVGQSKDMEMWASKLKWFEQQGMDVGFLLVRLRKLACLADTASRCTRLMEKRDAAKAELHDLEKQVGEVNERVELLDGEIRRLQEGSGSDRDFVKLANAPW